MAVIVTEKQFELPEDGQYLAVVADVIDLGTVTGTWGPKDRVQIVFLLDALNSQGEDFKVSVFANKSLHEKATLRKTLKAITRRDITGSYDMDEIIGTTVGVVTEQSESDGKTYSNISAIIPAPKGQKMEIPADFQRQVEKDGTGTTENPAAYKNAAKKQGAKPTFAKKQVAPEQPPISDEDIPF